MLEKFGLNFQSRPSAIHVRERPLTSHRSYGSGQMAVTRADDEITSTVWRARVWNTSSVLLFRCVPSTPTAGRRRRVSVTHSDRYTPETATVDDDEPSRTRRRWRRWIGISYKTILWVSVYRIVLSSSSFWSDTEFWQPYNGRKLIKRTTAVVV